MLVVELCAYNPVEKGCSLVSVILLVVSDEGERVMIAMALVLLLDEQDTNKMSNDNIVMLVITQNVDTFCTTLIMEDLICILLLFAAARLSVL